MKIRPIYTIVSVALLLITICAILAALIINGVIPVNPPRLQMLTDAGVMHYRSFAEGWEDSTEKYAFIATRVQVAKIIQVEALNKTTYLDCEEPTSKNRLGSILNGRPYWFTIKWSRELEHYAASQGPPVWKEMVYDPGSGQCLLKIWTD